MHDATLPTAVTNQTNHLGWELKMCKTNELNNELYIIKVSQINYSCMNNVKNIL